MQTGGKFSVLSFEFFIWSITILLELLATLLAAIFIVHFGLIFGIG